MKSGKMAKNTEKTQAELYREQRKARLAKAAAKKEKKSRKVTLSKGTKSAIAVLIAVAIVAGIAGYAVSAMGLKNRHTMVLSIGGDLAEVSQAEYSFYYSSVFSNYFNTAYQYDSYYGSGYGAMFTGGYDYKTSPDEQKYSEKLEGYENPTWADFFESSSIKTIMQIKALNKAANDEGVTLDEDDIAEIDHYITEMEEYAASQNYSMTAYLKTNYGEGVSKSLVKQIVTEQTLASKYEEVKNEEFGKEHSDKDIEKVYKKDASAYDKVGLAFYLVSAEKKTEKDDDGKETSAVTKATMKIAKKSAEKLAESKSLKELSKAVDKLAGKENSLNQYKVVSKDQITSNISSDVADWIYGKNVKVGDTRVFEVKDSGYYVCYVMATPFRNEVLPINIRHILVNFPEEETATDDKTTDSSTDTTEKKSEETEDKDIPALDTFKDAVIDMQVTAETAESAEAYEKAELILREYLAGDRTEDSFAALATENTEDTGSAENGGLYEGVEVGDMVEEFNDWCFDESRKPGDVGMVETPYGYHVMYFVGTASEEPTWKATIRSNLASEDYTEFAEKNFTEEKYPIEVLDQEAIDESEAFTIKYAKRLVASIAASASNAYSY